MIFEAAPVLVPVHSLGTDLELQLLDGVWRRRGRSCRAPWLAAQSRQAPNPTVMQALTLTPRCHGSDIPDDDGSGSGSFTDSDVLDDSSDNDF